MNDAHVPIAVIRVQLTVNSLIETSLTPIVIKVGILILLASVLLQFLDQHLQFSSCCICSVLEVCTKASFAMVLVRRIWKTRNSYSVVVICLVVHCGVYELRYAV